MNKSLSFRRWCLLALVLLAPGSFLVVPLLWLRWNRSEPPTTTVANAS